MIEVTNMLSQEMDLTYWQLRSSSGDELLEAIAPTINREEKELLRKILIAKAVKLEDRLFEIKPKGMVVVNLKNHQLIFNDVNLTDNANTIHLSNLTEMLTSPEEKKRTWLKLKGLDLIS